MRSELNSAARWTDIHSAARSSIIINNDNMGDNNSNNNSTLKLAQNTTWNTPSKLGGLSVLISDLDLPVFLSSLANTYLF